MEFPKPNFTVDTVVFGYNFSDEKLSILLGRRKNEPYSGELSLAGGFVNEFEEPCAAAVRELKEETGLDLPSEALLDLSLRWKDADPRGWRISKPFAALVIIDNEGNYANDVTDDGELTYTPLNPNDDLEDVKWYSLDILTEQLAFDHNEIIGEALGELVEHAYDKVNHGFLPNVLTLYDIECIQENIEEFVNRKDN